MLAIFLFAAASSTAQPNCAGSHDTTAVAGNGLGPVTVCAKDVVEAGKAASGDPGINSQALGFSATHCATFTCDPPKVCNAKDATYGLWVCVADPAVPCPDRNTSGFSCTNRVTAATCSCGPVKEKRCNGPHAPAIGDASATFTFTACGTDPTNAAANALADPGFGPAAHGANDTYCKTLPCDAPKICRGAKGEGLKVRIDRCVPTLNQCPNQQREFICFVRLLSAHCGCK